MRTHSTNDLKFRADIIAPDGTTVLASNVYAGQEDITGARVDQQQLDNAESNHVITFRKPDAALLSRSGYVRIDGVLFIVDYFSEPNAPRPGMWLEVYCHVERTTGA